MLKSSYAAGNNGMTSAVFVIGVAFGEPMEFPLGANIVFRCLQAHLVVGSKTRA